jgi:hypothetical protein
MDGSSLKPTSTSWQDEMHFTFDVSKCDRIFDYMLQGKQIKLPSNHVITSLEQPKMRIVNGIILILKLLTIAMFSVTRFNRPYMKDN